MRLKLGAIRATLVRSSLPAFVRMSLAPPPSPSAEVGGEAATGASGCRKRRVNPRPSVKAALSRTMSLLPRRQRQGQYRSAGAQGQMVQARRRQPQQRDRPLPKRQRSQTDEPWPPPSTLEDLATERSTASSTPSTPTSPTAIAFRRQRRQEPRRLEGGQDPRAGEDRNLVQRRHPAVGESGLLVRKLYENKGQRRTTVWASRSTRQTTRSAHRNMIGPGGKTTVQRNVIFIVVDKHALAMHF